MSAVEGVGGLGRTGRLLVVDDMDVNRELLVRRLRRLGHDTDAVDSGAAALAALERAAYDVVLLDVMMPGMNGFEVLDRIKANPRTEDVRVVMVSAVDESDSVARCIESGADDYLPKPVDPVLLRARVNSSLDRRRAADVQKTRAQALERELEIGREIQAGFFPTELPAVGGWEVAAEFQSARQVSGDFYDVFALAGGQVGMVVADVCDKGVGAALYMALFRSLIRSKAIGAATTVAGGVLATTLLSTNDYIAETHGSSNMFATVWFAALDPVEGVVTYVNAGHEPAALRRADGRVEWLMPTAPAVGLAPGLPFDTGTVRLGDGDILLACTDGVTEAAGPDGRQFGDAGVGQVLAVSTSAGAAVAALAAAVATHIEGAQPGDDLTILAVARS